MLHRTTDPSERAWDIAFRAARKAEEQYRQTGTGERFFSTLFRVYQEVLRELAGLPGESTAA